MKLKTAIQGMILVGACVAFAPAQAHPNHHDHWPIYGLIGLTLLDHNLSGHHHDKHHYYDDHDRRRHYDRPRQYSYGYQGRHQHKRKHRERRDHRHGRRE